MARRTRPSKPKLPRAPLPKQTEQVHENKKERPFRDAKHKKKWQDE